MTEHLADFIDWMRAGSDNLLIILIQIIGGAVVKIIAAGRDPSRSNHKCDAPAIVTVDMQTRVTIQQRPATLDRKSDRDIRRNCI
ncbi:hypothetical protein GCM10028790_24950 [Micromonospora taraxaci]|uniref:Uncharacterized protein n=1 Tax=Micromonospora taraxaci TaxID=1316803 RepID=A0A561VVJ1_9ACTN|nr:hypothetical protein FHU34_11954 [Micromonospora taraxaci]